MKPYLESFRKLSRVGLIVFALSIVASAVISIQYCTTPYHGNVPRMTNMFSPLIAFIYVGGVVLFIIVCPFRARSFFGRLRLQR